MSNSCIIFAPVSLNEFSKTVGFADSVTLVYSDSKNIRTYPFNCTNSLSGIALFCAVPVKWYLFSKGTGAGVNSGHLATSDRELMCLILYNSGLHTY